MKQLENKSNEARARKLYAQIRNGECGLIVYRTRIGRIVSVYIIYNAAIQSKINPHIFEILYKRKVLKRLSRQSAWASKQWVDTYTSRGRTKLYGK